MSYFKLSPRHKFTLNTRFRGRHANEPIQNTCDNPYYKLSIDENLDCIICECESFLPIPVGNVMDFNSLEEVWNSPIAKVLQQDVDQQKFTWCAVNNCSIRRKSIVNTSYKIDINIDDSCNLQCASCRRDKIMIDHGPVYEHRLKGLARILTWLEKFEHPITVHLMGNGDPLASPIIRPLIKTYQPKDTQKFFILTNGLLLKKNLSDSPILNNIIEFSISVDAGSKEVYEQVRFPGRWDVLIENLDYLKGIVESQQTKVRLNYALQQRNYKDLENFADLCAYYGFLGIVHELNDFGSWNLDSVLEPDQWTIRNGTFRYHNVLDSEHPDYVECKQIINKARSNRNLVFTPPLLHKVS